MQDITSSAAGTCPLPAPQPALLTGARYAGYEAAEAALVAARQETSQAIKVANEAEMASLKMQAASCTDLTVPYSSNVATDVAASSWQHVLPCWM